MCRIRGDCPFCKSVDLPIFYFFYLMENSVLGRSCIFRLVKSQNIVFVHEVFVREGWVNYKETIGKHNNGWSSV